MSSALRVAVVDDQALVRRGFAMMLDHEPDIDVVAEAGTGIEALAITRQHRPDVVLMDIRMPEMDGLTATATLLGEADWPLKIIILTTFDDDEYLFEGLRAGAVGYLLKDVGSEDLAHAVRIAAAGESFLQPSIASKVVGEFARISGRGSRRKDKRRRDDRRGKGRSEGDTSSKPANGSSEATPASEASEPDAEKQEPPKGPESGPDSQGESGDATPSDSA